MVKIINPFRGEDPIASMFRTVGSRLTGQQLNPLQMEDLKRKVMENGLMTDALSALGHGGFKNGLMDPQIAATMLGAGLDPKAVGGYGAQGAALADPMSADTTGFLAGMGQYDKAPSVVQHNLDLVNQLDQQKIAEAARQADQANATDLLKFGETPKPALIPGPAGSPVAGPGGIPIAPGAPGPLTPGFLPQSALTSTPGAQPILSDAEQKGLQAGNSFGHMGDLPPAEQAYLGADVKPGTEDPQATFQTYYDLAVKQGYSPEQAKNFAMTQAAKRSGGGSISVGPDGTTVDFGSIGLGGPTNATQSNLQDKEIGYQEFQTTKNQAIGLAKDPKIFGMIGNARYTVQAVGQIARQLGVLGGAPNLDAKIAAIVSDPSIPSATKSLIDHELMTTDPAIRAIRSLRLLLAYDAAKANGSTGRSLTDSELKNNMDMIGDPTAWLSTQDNFLASLATVDYNVRAKRNARLPPDKQEPLPPFSNEYLQKFIAEAKGQGVSAPAPAANLPTLTPEQAAQAPKGTRFKGTNGKTYTK